MRELLKLIDAEATYEIADFTIPVTILDVKNTWGNGKVLITPRNGTGEQWVMLSSIRMKEVGNVYRYKLQEQKST